VPKHLHIPLYPKISTATMTAALVDSDEYTIKPDNSTPSIDDSQWPLLLKNYNKCGFPFNLDANQYIIVQS
jgi:hypothetical protein